MQGFHRSGRKRRGRERIPLDRHGQRDEEEHPHRRKIYLFCPWATRHIDGFISYEEALAKASPEEPAIKVDADDIWVIMYTGGTTGKPKGVMKSHASLFAQYFIMIYDHSFSS